MASITNNFENPYHKTVILQSNANVLPDMPNLVIGIINSYSAELAVIKFPSHIRDYSSFKDTGPGAQSLVRKFTKNLNKYKTTLQSTDQEQSIALSIDVLKNILTKFGAVYHNGQFPQRTFDAYCSSAAIATIPDLPAHVFVLTMTMRKMYPHTKLDTDSTFESGWVAARIEQASAISPQGSTPESTSLQEPEKMAITASSSVQADSSSSNPG